MSTSNQPAPADRIDPNVKIPQSVRDAAARAAQIHEQAYQAPADAPAAPADAAPVTEPVTPAPAQDQPAQADAPAAAPAPVQEHQPAAPQQPEPSQEEWKHRFLSMQGRYQASQKMVGSLQEQISQMGDEMLRMQAQLQGQPVTHQTAPQSSHKRLTDKDVQEYGSELIDVVKRAAAEVVAPEVESLKQENAELQREVAFTARERLLDTLDHQLPEWRTINKNPRFLQWLRLPNVYTGVVRKQMLDQAYQAAHAPRVLAFFRDFLAEENATGQVPAPAQQAAPVAPRVAAVQLDTLASPGKARPASGNSDVPADKPIFTRAQIAHFYRPDTIKAYAGRERERAEMEQQIFAAQKEGRVR